VKHTLPISKAAISPPNLRKAEPAATPWSIGLLSATAAEARVRVSLLCDCGFRYSLAFCASADSGAQ
jgi:hypothetical protein